MLRKSFKTSKCKTALKLASSRIKILKNKREAQVKQLKKEVAQLLESGQDRTARIQVEHVVREEKTSIAYNLVEIYCELIVARLAIIESQKNCPIDLKEAIASVIFASPRCADIPELMDVRKQFAAKYGKEFISAAVELRPDCGVNRMLVEKLSAIAPDGQTKIKILTAIAGEHNIKWDPESSGEGDLKPREDLLNGPSSFEASKLHVEPHNVQVPPKHDAKGPNFHIPAYHEEKNDAPGNLYEHNASSTFRSQDLASTHIGSKVSVSRTFHSEMRPSGSGTEGMRLRHSSSGDASHFSLGNQNWNMEFKDATEAAQVAAESAERASIAARAAAELSSGGRISRQYSTKSQQSFSYGFRDEGPQRYPSSKLKCEDSAKDPADIAFQGRNRRMSADAEQLDNQQNNLAGEGERFYRDTTEASHSTSLKSNIESVDNPLVTSPPMTDRYSRKNSHGREKNDFVSEVSMRKQSSKSEKEFFSQDHAGLKFENINYGEEARINKQSSRASFSSHSSIASDQIVFKSNQHELGSDDGDNPSVVFDDGSIGRDTNKSISNDNASVAFDQSGSDDDDYGFDEDGKYQGQQSSLYFSSSGRNSPTHQLERFWSPRKNMAASLETSRLQSHLSTPSTRPDSHLVFSESSKFIEDPSKLDDLLPATFDDLDGPISESEEDWNKAQFPTIFSGKQVIYPGDPELTQRKESSFLEKRNVRSNTLLQPSLYDSEPEEVLSERNQGTQYSAGSEKKSVSGDFPGRVLSPRLAKSGLDSNDLVDERNHQQSQQFSRLSLAHEAKDTSQLSALHYIMKDTEPGNELSLESGKEINLSILTGGLRNKSYGIPPYIRSPLGDASTFRRTAGNASFKTEKVSYSSTVDASSNPGSPTQEVNNRKASAKLHKNPSLRASATYFDDDNMEAKPPQESFSSKQGSFNQKAGSEVHKKSSSRVPITYFGSNSSESEDDLSEKKIVTTRRPGCGVSRRTKVSPRNSDNYYMKATVSSGVSINSDYDAQKLSWTSPNTTDTQSKPQPQIQHSDHQGSSDHPETVEQVTCRLESKKFSGQESSYASARERRSSSFTEISVSIDSPRTKSSEVESPSKDNFSKQASHVHPKLPDYDRITAHLLSMRKNRQ